jgi:hypothetical protein
MRYALFCIATALCIASAACKDAAGEKMKTITLKKNNVARVLKIPQDYLSEEQEATSNYVIFVCTHPLMSPLKNQQNTPQSNRIRLTIEIPNKLSNTERFLQDFHRLNETNKASKIELIGVENGFEKYKNTTSAHTGNEATTYVSVDEKSHLLGITDPGVWSKTYTATHRIDADIVVTYQFSKELKSTFRQVDAAVVNLVNSFIH